MHARKSAERKGCSLAPYTAPLNLCPAVGDITFKTENFGIGIKYGKTSSDFSRDLN